MPRKVEVDVVANTKNLKKGLDEAGKATGAFNTLLGKLGAVGRGASSILDGLGIANLGAAGAVGIATGAIGTAIAVGEKAIGMYVELGNKVRAYAAVTGQSAEDASRQVAAFEELGIAADVAEAGMIKLSKAVNTNAKGLAELGIVTIRNKDGNIDLNATLLSVINAYQQTQDVVRRNAIVLTAFGKAGAAMIPILETNIGQLKELEKQVASVYTQHDLDQIRQYEIAQKHLKEQQDELGVSLGRTLLPIQLAFTESVNEGIYVSNKLSEATEKRGMSLGAAGHASGKAVLALQKEYQEGQNAKIAIDQLAEAQRRATEAALAEAAAEDTLYAALHKDLDASHAYKQALLDLKQASKDAHDAKGKDAQLNLRLAEAYFHVSDAAVELAVQQAAVAGNTLTAANKAQIQIDKLHALEKGLAPGSPLRKEIDAYIKQLKDIPASVQTLISTSIQDKRAKSGHGAIAGYAEGGTVPGPTGAPQLAVVHGGETVIPNGHGSKTQEIHIHIDQGAYIDGPGIDILTTKIVQRMRFATGL